MLNWFYLILGVLEGIIFALCFVSSTDKKLAKTVEAMIVFPVTIGFLYFVNRYFGVEGKDVVEPSVYYLGALFVTFSAVYLSICYFITRQNKIYQVKLRVLDVIFGYSSSLNEYFTNRKKEIDVDLNISEIRREFSDLEKEKKKVQYLKEKNNGVLEKIKEAKDDPRLYMVKLPIENDYFVSKGSVTSLPEYTRNYANFCVRIEEITDKLIAEYNQSNVKRKKKDTERLGAETAWMTYFIALCNAVNQVLFDTHTSSVRTHLRVLVNENYVKVLSIDGSNDGAISQTLTTMPKDKGMIRAARENQSSVVMSLNPERHHKAKHDSRYQDYMTFIIEGFEENGYPLLTMGISVTSRERYSDFLCFLNYIRVEETINNSIQKLNECYSLNEFILNWRSKNG